MQRRPKKAKRGPELKKRRPADRFKGCASTGPVQNKAVLKSRLDWKKAEMRDICRGMLDGHGGHLRIRNGGGKTPAQFRRFSSSTPARLADGLGSKRLSLADGRCAPKTWVPRPRRITGLGDDRDSLPANFCQAARENLLGGKKLNNGLSSSVSSKRRSIRPARQEFRRGWSGTRARWRAASTRCLFPPADSGSSCERPQRNKGWGSRRPCERGPGGRCPAGPGAWVCE